MGESNILVVSNRLPGTVKEKNGNFVVVPSSGGLVTAMKPILKSGMWIGWPGSQELEGLEEALQAQTQAPFAMKAVYIPHNLVRGYYDGYANSILWPLFHGFVKEAAPHLVNRNYWNAYKKVNALFAQKIEQYASPNHFIWVHDYHLLLTGSLLRNNGIHNNVGFFLHIPFPKPHVFVKLPQSKILLEALLNYDLVGFHTLNYAVDFIRSVRLILPQAKISVREGEIVVRFGKKSTKVGVFPISIDADAFMKKSQSQSVAHHYCAICNRFEGKKLVLHVSRLDYTKGHDKELEALRILLTQNQELVKKLHLVQIIVPSRESVSAYQEYKQRITTLASEINHRFGKVVTQEFRSVEMNELLGWYKAADVLDVPSVADGMNLVAKEWAVTGNKQGVLLLSQYAGAAEELTQAIISNPKDAKDLAQKMLQALHLENAEKEMRKEQLKQQVHNYTVIDWAKYYLHSFNQANRSTSQRDKFIFS